MRVILFTGKGGVGKTCIAAATALAASNRGVRTLITSTDPAHSLADSFEADLGDSPAEISPKLWGQQIDTQARLEENWREIRDYAVELLEWTGMAGIEAEELSVIPGLDELFALSEVKQRAQSGEFDLLIVDCAPTAETLRLLSLPDVMTWYIEKIFPIGRIVSAIRPVLRRVPGLPPIASEEVFDAVERFHRRIEGVKDILSASRGASVRLVVNAEKMVIAEAQRTFTYLSLFGYRVDAVIVNRLIPSDVFDPYFDRWKDLQSEHMEVIDRSFAPVPILRAKLFDREIVGMRPLEDLAAAVYGDSDPAALLYVGDTMRVVRDGPVHLLQIPVPLVDRGSVDLVRVGDEIFVKVGAVKRSIALPQMLRQREVGSAVLEDGRLTITFQARVAVGSSASDGRSGRADRRNHGIA